MGPRPTDRDLEARNLVCTLIKRSAAGEQAAFSRLHALTRGKMRATARAVLPATADIDDVLQEAYLKIWRNAGNFDPARSSPISWMSVITRNTALDAARRPRLATAELELATDIPIVADEQDDFDYAFAQRVASHVIGRLPEERRKLLSLAYLEGYSREALSQIFGAPKGTIKTWLRRTLEGVSVDCAALARRPAFSLAVAGRKR
jgi:RNA polymerase sigma-70 factor (ECF subfamily)